MSVLPTVDLLIDALLGTGAEGPVEGISADRSRSRGSPKSRMGRGFASQSKSKELVIPHRLLAAAILCEPVGVGGPASPASD